MALHVLDEANRCLGCKKPMCQEGCPIHTNIPEVIRLLKANQMDDAGRMLFENNPLTTVCSLVCNHENQCEGHCIRNRMPSHDPVHFSIIEDYISTTYANKMTSGPAPRNGMKAAVVGSGPAGLTVAVLLARWGYDVTIFDARDKIGGVMRYGIPNYRLPDSVLDDFQYRHLELKGIHVRPNTAIGKTITIDDLFRDGYKSVFIGAGLWKANAMHIKGETLGNVAFGIDYLANSKAFQLGDDIAVIGVGNSAMDCARTAIRNGARHVTCYARRDESCISASEYEVSYAKLEGVGFRFCKAPVEIRENGLICRDTVKGEDGKFTAIDGYSAEYKADQLNEEIRDILMPPLNLEDDQYTAFAASISSMMVRSYAVAIVKPAEGKTNEVKAALEAYVASEQQSMEHYLEDQYLVAKAATVTVAPTGEVVLVCAEDHDTILANIEKALAA